MQAVVDPGQAGVVEGVGEHPEGLAVMLEEDEFAFQALGQADPLEQRRGGEQRRAVEQRVMQGGAQALDKRCRLKAAERLQGIEQALAAEFGTGPGLGQQRAAKGRRGAG